MSVKNFPKRLDSKTSCLRITVPENLDLALEGLIRKVLKEQPKIDDIHSFAADYFEMLLKIRDKSGGKQIPPQLCSFHNDEDANEMIKLASTFNVPEKNIKPINRTEDTKRGRETENKKQTKGMKKTKSKVTSKSEEKSAEETKPDLVKKLSRVTGDRSKEKKKEKTLKEVEEKEGNKRKAKVEIDKKEKNKKELLEKAPIKELIEKELKEVNEKSTKEILNEEKEDKKIKEETLLNDVKEGEDESLQEELEKNKESETKEKVINDVIDINNEKPEATEESNTTTDSESVEKIKNFEKTNSNITKDKTADEEEFKLTEENQKSSQITQSQDANITEKEEENTKEHSKEKEIEKTEGKIFSDEPHHDKSPGTVLEPSESEIRQKDETKEIISDPADAEEINLEKENALSVKEGKPENDLPPKADVEQTEKMSEPNLDQKSPNVSPEEQTEQTERMSEPNLDRKSSHLSVEEQTEQTERTEGTSKPNLEQKSPHLSVEEQTEKMSEPNLDQKSPNVSPEERTEQTEGISKSNVDQKSPNISAEEQTEQTEEMSKPNLEQKSPSISPEEQTEGMTKPNVDQKSPNISAEEQTEQTEGSKPNADQKSPHLSAEEQTEQTEGISKPNLDEKSSNISAQETNCPDPERQEKNIQKETEIESNNDTDTRAVKEKSFIISEEANMETVENLENNNENNKNNLEENQEKLDLTEETENLKTNSEEPQNKFPDEVEGSQNIQPETKEFIKNEIISDFGNKTNEDIISSNVEDLGVAKVMEEKQTTEPHFEHEEHSTVRTESSEMKITNENTGKLNIIESSLNEDIKDKENTSKETSEGKSVDEQTLIEAKEAIKSEQNLGNDLPDSKSNTKKSQNAENITLTAADLQDIPEEQSEISCEQQEENINETMQKLENKNEEREMCTVVDNQQIPESDTQKSAGEMIQVSDAMKDKEHDQDIVEPIETKTEKKPEESSTEITENKEDQIEPEEELCTVVDIHHIPQKEIKKSNEDLKHPSEEQIQKEEEHAQNEGERSDTIEEDREEKKDTIQTTQEKEESGTTDNSRQPNIIQVEEPEGKDLNENISKSSEVKIKTIQTHYYDTLQVPQTETKELKVHSVRPLSPLDVAEMSSSLSIPKEITNNTKDKNINAFDIESSLGNLQEHILTPMTTVKILEDLKSEPHQSVGYQQNDDNQTVEAKNQLNLGSDIQRIEFEDSLDPTTPSSDYSLNLSELSWQTISGMFLDSERQYSSIEKEITKFAISKSAELMTNTEDVTKTMTGKPEIEEVFQKTVLSSDVTAVPVPPRSVEEIDREASSQIFENPEEKIKDKPKDDKLEEDEKPETEGKEKKSKDDEPEEDEKPEAEGEEKKSKNDETEEDKNKPDSDQFENSAEDSSINEKSIDSDTPFISVEVKTFIESQILDDEEEEEEQPQMELKVEATIEIQGEEMQKGREEAENKMSDGKENAEEPKQNQTFNDEGGGFNRGKESSSNESDSTISSAVTEIKRSDSSRRNPLLKTRSLSTFRHGVTDFEVWNTIEKELEEAATKIQSQFRSYKTRKKLQRENAVQITTEESSASTTSAEAERQQTTGEFHDSIVLSEHPR